MTARIGIGLATSLACLLFAGSAWAGEGAGTTGPIVAKKGSTNYTTHYIFHPVGITETPGVGKVSALILLGNTTNTDGQPIFDKMAAKCHAIKVETGGNTYLDGACSMTDEDGHSVFSTFDSRKLDPSQPKMNCGTHVITGGTGKYAGISGTEPFACIFKPTPAGVPPSSYNPYAVEVLHATTWEIK